MHIVFAADQAFVRQLLVASGSAVYACRNGGGANLLVVHVLDCGIEETTWNDYASRIARLAERVHVKTNLVRHVIDMKQFENFSGWTNGSKAIWARILIPRLLPDVDQCVYSDCDMLFLANPVEMLSALDEPNMIFAGHRDPTAETCEDAIWHRKKNFEFDTVNYICAGLVAMDLDAFRAGNLVRKCFGFVEQNPDIPLLDQTTLNQVCLGRKALFHDGWGLFPHECHAFEGRIKAIHYAGCRCWPWQKPRIYQHVAWMDLAKEEFALWLDFEKRVLGLSLPGHEKPSPKLRLQASALLMLERLGNLLGFHVGHGRFQELVAAHDKNTSALAIARQELFGEVCDSKTLRVLLP